MKTLLIIADMKSDVRKLLFVDMAQCARGAVQKRFRSQYRDTGVGGGLASQVFAAAKADF